MNNPSTVSKTLRILSVIALLFGLMTIKSGGSVLFGTASAKLAAGNAVNFVLWFNFLAGFAYISAAPGLWLGKRWAMGLSGLIALMTMLVFIALGVHIAGGGEYENRTLAAMTLRTAIWATIYYFARRIRA
jgi:hypothetical protein